MIWVDTDLALGTPSGDVDDGFALAALLAAARRGDCRLLGISTVAGNTTAARAAGAARDLLAVAAQDLPVVDGSDGDAAARALAGLPAGAVVLALGPLGNLGAALALDPTLAERVTVRVVGGNLASRGRWPPYWPFEFNLAKQASAARAVFASPMGRRLYPLDQCRRLRAGPRWLAALRHRGALGGYLAHHSWRWLAYAPLRYQRLAFPLWDLVPALDLLGLLPVEVTSRPLRLSGRGRLTTDPTAAPPTECVTLLDPAAGLDAFAALLG